MNGEDSLATSKINAAHQLSCCCESACDKYLIYEYIIMLEQKVEELEKELQNGSR